MLSQEATPAAAAPAAAAQKDKEKKGTEADGARRRAGIGCSQARTDEHLRKPKQRTGREMAPTSEEKWKEYGIDVKWDLTWPIKPKYASPRDVVVWLQLQHRTLWVAKNGEGAQTTSAQRADAPRRKT